MPRSCQIPTPNEYIKVMLNEAGYLTDLVGKRVLENSCGNGNILVKIVQRYIGDCKRKGIAKEEIQKGLERDIVGYEVDQDCVNACIKKLNAILSKEKIDSVNWDIRNSDYLCAECEEFDYIIGNPPYITYHNLTKDERSHLKRDFNSCKKGRFDYYYAFVEKSYCSLKQGGTLVYLVPFSIFRNKFAGALRAMIKDDIISVIDYSGTQVFEGVMTSSAIIHIQKSSNVKKLKYKRDTSKKTVQITKSSLSDKWFFSTNTGNHRFGDFYSIHNSVATLCNEAFIITNYNDVGECVEIGDHRIEKGILRPAVSTKSFKYHKQRAMIVFPYKIGENGFNRYSEEELQKKFPGAYTFIKSFSERLEKRKVNSGVQWFEYGRTQALKNVQGEKLVIPMVITSKVTAFLAEDDAIPYAGYFIKPKTRYSLQFAKKILEGPCFYKYVKEKGTPTTKASYRISIKEIENFTF